MSKDVHRPYRDDLIRAQMAAKEITTDELRELSGVSAFTISRIRNGGSVRVDSLAKIVGHLDLTMKDIFDFERPVADVVSASAEVAA